MLLGLVTQFFMVLRDHPLGSSRLIPDILACAVSMSWGRNQKDHGLTYK